MRKLLMQIKKEWTAFDVVTGMFVLVAQKHGEVIPDRRGGLHSALFEIAQKREYSNFFGEYVFNSKGSSPRAASFDVDLNNMTMSGFIKFSYPDYAGYEVLPQARAAFEGHIGERFSGQERATIERMAEDFYQCLGAKASA
jgi:hypothetical protein